MTLGEKIRFVRIKRGLTQRDLCGDKITRNMLSAIENNKANPSLDTIEYISAKLQIPMSYILSKEESPFTFEKQQGIGAIKAAFVEKRYYDCIEMIDSLDGSDDELNLILANATYECGKKQVLAGSLFSGAAMLMRCVEACNGTIYNTDSIKKFVPLYLVLTKNIQSPLLELDSSLSDAMFAASEEYELYKYMNLDSSHSYSNKIFAKHIEAKEMIKRRDYYSAINILVALENAKTGETYNAYAFFAIYSDLETCYRQIGDFEKAYRYSTKRLSMIEGFKT